VNALVQAQVVLPAALALLVSLLSPAAWLPVLRRWGAVDEPSSRSSHTVATVRGVGLGPASGVVVAALASAVRHGASSPVTLTLFGIALAAALLGLLEDVHGMPVPTRFTLQLGLGVVTGLALVTVVDLPLWSVVLVALCFTGYVNAANFMDGIDGISLGHGLACGAYFSLVGSRSGLDSLVLCGLVLAAAYLGFAPWNLGRSRVFLGDCGSYLLGAGVVLLAVVAVAGGLPLLVAVAPLLPYLADTGLTLARRAVRGERVWQPHRSHTYQRLVRQGLSHVTVAAVVTLVAALCGVLAWWGDGDVTAWAGCAAVLALYLASPALLLRTRSGVVA